MAYVLIGVLRRIALNTQLAVATCATICLEPLKIAPLVRISVRHIYPQLQVRPTGLNKSDWRDG
jgi:hypothetical protein